jgi:ABC-type transport system substrate-binding protein
MLLVAMVAVTAGSFAPAQDEPPPPDQPPAGDQATPPADENDPGSVTLPKLEDLPPPTLEDLLNGPGRDWVVLLDGKVIVSEPIIPRPNTLEQLETMSKAMEKERRGKTGDALERFKKELDDLKYVNVILPGPPAREFRVPRTKVSKIIHHEDHVIAKIDSLLAEKNIETANELLVRFERQWPDWPGIKDRRYLLIFDDASARMDNGDPESALVLLEELHTQLQEGDAMKKVEYPGLDDLAGRAVEALVNQASQDNDPSRGRHFLMRLTTISPGNPVIERLAGNYIAQANELMNQSKAATQAGKHAEAATLADKAVEMWPPLVALKAPQKAAFERYQRLRVGVTRLNGSPKATPFDAEAEVRGRKISENRLFEVDDFRGGIPHYRTSYLDEWEPFDLGKRMRFTLTQTRQPWEAQPPLDAVIVASLLQQQFDPQSPTYDERLSSVVGSVTVESPLEFSLTFKRVPPRIEPVLRTATSGASMTSVTSADGGETQNLPTGGFPIAESTATDVVYRRLRPEPDGLPQYHLAEVVEHKYSSHEKAFQGLLQGEVWMLPDLPDWIVRRAQADRKLEKDFFIQKYAVPTTHILQFNPKSRALGFRELRRALLHAVDRDKLLDEIVLRDTQVRADETELATLKKESSSDSDRIQSLEKRIRDHRQASHGRVVNTPFPSFSYANSPQLIQQGFDLSASVAMAIAVAKQMGGQIPPLRMAVPPEPVPQAVAAKLVRAWSRVGIDVVLVEAGTQDAAGWDIAYRTQQIEEPVVELWPFLTVQDRASVEDLVPFPDWMKQELIALDRMSDWNRAVELVQTLHRHLWADVRFIPLWELDGYLIYRKQVRGVPTEPLHCYEQLDRWSLEAWYATQTP